MEYFKHLASIYEKINKKRGFLNAQLVYMFLGFFSWWFFSPKWMDLKLSTTFPSVNDEQHWQSLQPTHPKAKKGIS